MSRFSKSEIKIRELIDDENLNCSLLFYFLLTIHLFLSSIIIYSNSLVLLIKIWDFYILALLFFIAIKYIKNIIEIIVFIILSIITLYILLRSDNICLFKIIMFLLILYFMYLSIKKLPENLLPLYFKTIFNYKAYKIKNHDFFTNEIDYIFNENIRDKKDGVFFFITPIEKMFFKDEEEKREAKEKHKKLIEKFTELAFFWYAYKFEKVKLRSSIPIFSFLLSAVFFIYTLFLLNSLNIDNKVIDSNILKMSFVVIFSIVLYYSLLIHVNKFLDPEYYLDSIFEILESLKINFPKNLTNDQKVILFLDKTFLINIYNAKTKEFFSLNNNKKFIEFILKYNLDKEGRDYIINIFVSVFMVIYITIFVTILVDSETDKFIKDNNNTLINFIKKRGDKNECNNKLETITFRKIINFI